mmetsp:Transcript_9140/g.40231  ORF Transcript_9140/g.40231 Transcript_9140/m.40231 type:complete len:207 (-) Transcript_9140:1764-2384(-)
MVKREHPQIWYAHARRHVRGQRGVDLRAGEDLGVYGFIQTDALLVNIQLSLELTRHGHRLRADDAGDQNSVGVPPNELIGHRGYQLESLVQRRVERRSDDQRRVEVVREAVVRESVRHGGGGAHSRRYSQSPARRSRVRGNRNLRHHREPTPRGRVPRVQRGVLRHHPPAVWFVQGLDDARLQVHAPRGHDPRLNLRTRVIHPMDV